MKTKTLDYLYFTVNGLEKKHPFIVVGDFNTDYMRKVILKYVNMKLKDSFKSLPWPAFGEGDHISILLLPAYRQWLKLKKINKKKLSDQSTNGVSSPDSMITLNPQNGKCFRIQQPMTLMNIQTL